MDKKHSGGKNPLCGLSEVLKRGWLAGMIKTKALK